MDQETLQDISEGDKGAYSRLYSHYFKKLYNYGKKFTADTSHIEDAIQEIFLEAWNQKQRLPEIESVSSYFFSSFRYALFKKIKQSNRIIQSDEFETEPEFSIDIAMIAKEQDRELQQKLASALNSLTAHQREAVFLRFYEGLSYEEVASVLNISVKGTYKIMARSLSALKESLLISLGVLNLFNVYGLWFMVIVKSVWILVFKTVTYP